jgi:hypothetical protein
LLPIYDKPIVHYLLTTLVLPLKDIPDRWGILTAHRRRLGMKNPVYEQIQARKVKARLRMLQCAARER